VNKRAGLHPKANKPNAEARRIATKIVKLPNLIGLPVNTARHSSSSLFLGQPTPIPVILVVTDEQNSGFTA
jgi:hypothetical protein